MTCNDTTLSNQPWRAIKFNIQNGLYKIGPISTGFIYNGAVYAYFGFCIGGPYGAFRIITYDSTDIRTYVQINNWYYSTSGGSHWELF